MFNMLKKKKILFLKIKKKEYLRSVLNLNFNNKRDLKMNFIQILENRINFNSTIFVNLKKHKRLLFKFLYFFLNSKNLNYKLLLKIKFFTFFYSYGNLLKLNLIKEKKFRRSKKYIKFIIFIIKEICINYYKLNKNYKFILFNKNSGLNININLINQCLYFFYYYFNIKLNYFNNNFLIKNKFLNKKSKSIKKRLKKKLIKKFLKI